MFRLLAIAVVTLVIATMPQPAPAARPAELATAQPDTIELYVFETETCLTCRLFRRDVAPGYEQSPRQRTTPMKFVDVDGQSTPHPGLERPLVMLPTAVIMRNGREIARIEGYFGPEPFFQMIARAFARLDP